MEKLKPKLFSVMKTYTREQFVKDVVAGIIVAIIALPLSIALALASGVTPEKGIYTAITAGFVISFLGGSRVQIAGPTAAFATIVAGIVAKNGMGGLIIATLLAGVILILMGLLRLGNLIKFIPYTITTGFTSGIAVTIFIGQIKDFLGLSIVTDEPLIETMDKLKAVFVFIGTLNVQALLVGVLSLAILIFWPMLPGFLKRIPASLIAVIAGSAAVAGLHLNVNTIGDLYEISNKLPAISLPAFSLTAVQNVLPDAFTIAILAAIESLLSCVVADSMVNSRHRSNMELIAQGAGNITSALFGGIPATGAIARTAANIKNGGRTPIAGMVHSVVLLLILVVYQNNLYSFSFEGQAGWVYMQDLMHTLRTAPPKEIGGLALEQMNDYSFGLNGLPKANVLEFCLHGGAKAIVRPSGTEPKLKLYLFARADEKRRVQNILSALHQSITAKCPG